MMMKYLYMTIKLNHRTFFVFDLDDTLFQEVDFLRSAYRAIARNIYEHSGEDIFEEMFARYKNKENVFAWIVSRYGSEVPDLTLDRLLKAYREHMPEINLSRETRDFLDKLHSNETRMGLITDGRSITQRNKLKALGISHYFSDIIISEEFGSEKPDPRNFLYFQEKYPGSEFYMVADNTKKDFIIPGSLGWTSICIKDAGQNIHVQNYELLPNPDYLVNSFKDIVLI